MFENKTHFPRFYRLVPIAEDFADGFVALVKRLNWNRVAVLSYDEDFVFNVKFCVVCLSLHCAAQYILFSMHGHKVNMLPTGILKHVFYYTDTIHLCDNWMLHTFNIFHQYNNNVYILHQFMLWILTMLILCVKYLYVRLHHNYQSDPGAYLWSCNCAFSVYISRSKRNTVV